MPMRARHKEIEIKLPVRDFAVIRRRLNELGAREYIPRTFESNTLFDTAQNDLRRRGQLLRVRIERPARNPGNRLLNENTPAILTFKAPPRSSRRLKKAGRASKMRRPFKVREEVEVSFAGARQMAGILRALGYRPVFCYEKVRTTYALPNLRGLKIELDETPIGNYIELEGPVAGIDQAARLLGYTRSDYITATYGSLNLAECRRQGRKRGDMLFPPTKKLS